MMTPTVWRCSRCGAKLARVALTAGSAVEVKCGHCNTFTWMPSRTAWEAATANANTEAAGIAVRAR